MRFKDKVKVIILAAGKGTRMKSDIPKALQPLRGKPFIKHILDTIDTLQLPNKPIVVIGHKKELVMEALGDACLYAEQKEQLGTGHAVGSAQNMAKTLPPEDGVVFVLSADQPLVSKETIESILKKHSEENPKITIGTVTVENFADWRNGLEHFGRIVRDRNGSIQKIVEFKNATEQEKAIREINPALYAFDENWLWQNIEELKNNNNQGEYLLTDLIKIACEQKMKIATVPIRNTIEAMQPNSREELSNLEKIFHTHFMASKVS